MTNQQRLNALAPSSALNGAHVEGNKGYNVLQNAITETIAEATDLDHAIMRIIQAICVYTDWDFGEAWDIDPATNLLVHRLQWQTSSGHYPKFEEISRQITFAPGLGLPGRVWKTVSPHWIPDVAEDANFLRASFAAREGLRSGVGLVLRSRENAVGVLSFFSRTIRPRDSNLLELFDTVGLHIGLYMKRQLAQLNEREQLQREAVLQERRRLAHEIQHVTMRSLYSAAITAETLPYLWESNQNKLWYGLGEMRQSVQQALMQSQSLLAQLSVERPSESGIKQLLEPLVESFRQKMHGAVSFTVRGSDPLPITVQISVYCLMQEALDNIIQHARAPHANIGLTIDPGGNELVIVDDGKGYIPGRVLPDRLGLRIMHGCAEAIGGKLDVVVAANQGTKIVLTWRTLT